MTTTPFMSREGMTRCRMVGAAPALGVARCQWCRARRGRAAPTASGPVQLTLPVPTVLRPAAERTHPEVEVSGPGPQGPDRRGRQSQYKKLVVDKAENELSAVTRTAPSQGFRT